MVESKLTDTNVKGKVIIPLPELQRALATKSLKIDSDDFKKSLYAVAFGDLINYLTTRFLLVKDSKGNWNWQNDKTELCSFAVLNTFETFSIVHCTEDVNFTLGEKSNWSRPFYFSPYANETPFSTPSGMVNFQTNLGYIKFVSRDADLSYTTVADRVTRKRKITNIRTTNAFIRKFGCTIDNPDFSEDLNKSLNLMNKYSK